MPHHITQRGNRRQQTFFNDADYAAYLELMAEWCNKEGVEIWAYACMPNHIHLVAIPGTEEAHGRGQAYALYYTACDSACLMANEVGEWGHGVLVQRRMARMWHEWGQAYVLYFAKHSTKRKPDPGLRPGASHPRQIGTARKHLPEGLRWRSHPVTHAIPVSPASRDPFRGPFPPPAAAAAVGGAIPGRCNSRRTAGSCRGTLGAAYARPDRARSPGGEPLHC